MPTLRAYSLALGLTLGLVLLLPATVSAHHGWSQYGSEDFSLTGTVVEKHFGNPHDRLTVEVDGRRWNVVLSPPSRSERAGFTDANVEVGDTITAFGRRHRDADTLEMKAERIEVGAHDFALYPERL